MKSMDPSPIKSIISLNVLDSVDVRVGTIECVENVEGSDKLVKLLVDFGDHKRTILAGMKRERDELKEIEGKQALFVVNLEPKKIMGQISEGMLLSFGSRLLVAGSELGSTPRFRAKGAHDPRIPQKQSR